MITLSLLHPIKQIPVQLWTFENESVIRIGRSTDNHVILYSAVVSRHHVELRRVGSTWEAVNLGTNGTYLDGKRITQMPVTDGSVIRLARSGPNIKIRLGTEGLNEVPDSMRFDRTETQPRPESWQMPTEVTERGTAPQTPKAVKTSQRPDPKDSSEMAEPVSGIIPVPPHLQLQRTAMDLNPAENSPGGRMASHGPSLAPLRPSLNCLHLRGGEQFCVECGEPLRVIDTLGHYQLLQVLGQSDVSITYQAWHNGKVVALKTLNEEWRQDPRAIAMLDYEADTLRSLLHPQLPHFVESFRDEDKPALVMEMMTGENLRDFILRRGPLPLERAIAWILQICEILHYLHSFIPPIVHRDLRPQNLILKQADGQDLLALVDFGAVKRVILGLPMPPGSKGYTAPEQMDLQPTPPTDLYGLAPLLAFLTTGQNPVAFYGDDGRFQAEMVPRLPQEMMLILNRLTEPDPEARYANVDELIEALQAVRVGV